MALARLPSVSGVQGWRSLSRTGTSGWRPGKLGGGDAVAGDDGVALQCGHQRGQSTPPRWARTASAFDLRTGGRGSQPRPFTDSNSILPRSTSTTGLEVDDGRATVALPGNRPVHGWAATVSAAAMEKGADTGTPVDGLDCLAPGGTGDCSRINKGTVG